jgi:uncharacterized protein (UPF0332 family)
MTSKELDSLVRIKLIKTEPADRAEIEGLLRVGRIRLHDAKNKDNSFESRFDLAYNAVHALALAALRSKGYRPNNARYVVFQALPHTLGLGPEIWRVLDKCHTVRNAAEYQGFFEVDERLLADLLKSADIVNDALRAAAQ